MTSSRAAPPRHLALVGMMGSGKSAVGRSAAKRLHRRFVDLDSSIEANVGRSIPEIFAARGESDFRSLESRVLADELASVEAIVLATGGGVLLREDNRVALSSRAHVVWLRATPETLVARVGDGRGRPLLAGNDVAVEVKRLDDERRSLYEQAANLVIDVDALTLEEVEEAIVSSVAEAAR